MNDQNIVEGYTIDLCLAIALDLQERLGMEKLEVQFVKVKASERLDAIVSGQAHIECSNTTVTFARLEHVDFSNLTYMTGATFMTTADSGIFGVNDLVNKTIGVVEGTTTERALADYLKAQGVAAKVQTLTTYDLAISMLASGRLDALAGDRALLTGLGVRSKDAAKLRLTSELFTYEPYALPVPRNDADFRLQVNRSLARVYESGEVGRIWQKWFGSMNLQPTRELLMLYRLNSLPE